VARDDWFRTADWTATAQADFERRLARTRKHNRLQYLRFKAASLASAGNDAAAEQLLRRVLASDPDYLHAAACHESLGDLALGAGNMVEAEAQFRACLRVSPDGDATTGEAYIGLAEALVGQHRFREAVEALDAMPAKWMVWPHTVCRWNATRAEAAHGEGDEDVASRAAQAALEQIGAKSQFADHADLGAARLSPERAKRLRKMTRQDTPSRHWLSNIASRRRK